MARLLLASSGALALLSSVLLSSGSSPAHATVAPFGGAFSARRASAPGFVHTGLLQCRGGEAASLSKTAGAAMAAASEQHNASSVAPVKDEQEEDEAQFHDAVAAEAEERGVQQEQEEEEQALNPAAEQQEEGTAAAPASAAAVEADAEEEESAAAAVVEQELSGPEAVRRRRAQEAGAAGGKKPKDKFNAKMQWVITGRMKKILVEELHYLPEEVENMMPDVAAVVINKHLERPKRGMPPEWRRDFHLRSRGLKRVKASVRRALARVQEDPASVLRGLGAVAAGAVALTAAKRWRDARVAEEEDEYEWVEVSPWEELVDSIQTRLPALPFRKGSQ